MPCVSQHIVTRTDPDFTTTHATPWYQAPDRQLYKRLIARAEVTFILG